MRMCMSHTHTHTPHPRPSESEKPPHFNPLNVIIIIIIIITLGNSGNSTSSFNSQLGVQEQRRHALYDSGPRNPPAREGARRTREAHQGEGGRGHGTDSKAELCVALTAKTPSPPRPLHVAKGSASQDNSQSPGCLHI